MSHGILWDILWCAVGNRLPTERREIRQDVPCVPSYSMGHPMVYYETPWDVLSHIPQCQAPVPPHVSPYSSIVRPCYPIRWLTIY